jgi:hypothetical protein
MLSGIGSQLEEGLLHALRCTTNTELDDGLSCGAGSSCNAHDSAARWTDSECRNKSITVIKIEHDSDEIILSSHSFPVDSIQSRIACFGERRKGEFGFPNTIQLHVKSKTTFTAFP